MIATTRAKAVVSGILSLTLGSLLLASTAFGETKPIKLILADMFPPAAMTSRCQKWWGDEIEKRTGGKVKFEYYFGASLVGPMEQMESVKNNVIQVTSYLSSYHPDSAPITTMGAFPLVNTGSLDSALLAAHEWFLNNPEVKKEFAKNKVKYLNPGFGADAYMWSKVPIKSVDDLKGLTIRAFGPWLDLFSALGSSVVSVPVPEIYNTLERGVVKGTMLFLSNGVSLKLYEVTEYLNTTNLGHIVGLPLAMNLETWNSLPDDVKKVIDEINAKDAIPNYVRIYNENRNREMDIVKQQGMKITNFSAADLEKMKAVAKEKVWLPYARELDKKGLHGTEALEDWEKIMAKYK